MEMIFVRHARPNEQDSPDPGDPSLGEEGRDQADLVCAYGARFKIDRIFSSPQARARQTAAPLATAKSIDVEIVEGLAEVDYGAPIYRSPETIRAVGEAEWRRFVNDPFGFFGVEQAVFRERVVGAYEDIVATLAPDSTAFVFAHGLTIKTIISHIAGTDLRRRLDLSYASFCRIAVGRTGDALIRSLGETAHLDALQRREPP